MAKDLLSFPDTTASSQGIHWKLPNYPWKTDSLGPAATNGLSHPSTSFTGPQGSGSNGTTPSLKTLGKRRRQLDEKEENLQAEISDAISYSLASDHLMALYPDLDSPFQDERDAVNRLLPFHVFQIPKLEASGLGIGKGKGKAVEPELRNALEDDMFSLECLKRYRKLVKRFKSTRIRPGKHSAPHDLVIPLYQHILEADRAETTALEQDHATCRSELEKAQRVKKLTSNPSRTTTSSTPFYNYTPQTGSPYYRLQSNVPYTQYYTSYSYPYSQSLPATHQTPASTPATPVASVSQPTNHTTPQTSSSQSNGTHPLTTIPSGTPQLTTSQQTTNQNSTSPETHTVPLTIPIQLPISSLGDLKNLDILPVPKSAVLPPPHPTPPAVLLGTANQGTTLMLELNVGRLQRNQVDGLARILSTLMQNSRGQAQITTTTPSNPEQGR